MGQLAQRAELIHSGCVDPREDNMLSITHEARLLGLDSSDITKNLITGIIGSLVGGLIGSLIGLQATGLLGSIIMAVIGACAAIVIYRKFIRK